MTDPSDVDEDSTLHRLLTSYLEAIERGEPIDRDAIRRTHPDYAELICEFLDENARLRSAVSPLREPAADPPGECGFSSTVDSQRTRAPARERFYDGERLRYIGEYEVIEEIARGGMGIIFKARQTGLRRIVALKMILSGRLASSADVERFHREARAAAALQHPNIVSVHAVGQHEGLHYFTMDFVDGQSLATIIRGESLAPKRTAALIVGVAKAIAYAHQQGVLHRDLKPANILVDEYGRPHVTDFGLAKTLAEEVTLEELTSTGQILGTPGYMSPEQASAKHNLVGVASDVYSLGAIMYACLCGRAPFVADSVVETLRQVIGKDPVPLRLFNPAVPKDLENICLKCLHKEPHRRYGTANLLADDLQRYLDGRPVLARPVAISTKAWQWAKRNPGVASLSALSILLLVGGTAISLYLTALARRHADSERNQRIVAVRETQAALAAREKMEEALRSEEAARGLAEKSLQASRWNVYKMSLFPLLDAWQKHEFGLLESRLEDAIPQAGEPDLRGWEWKFFQHAVATRTIHAQANRPYLQVQYDASGNRFAARRSDGAIDVCRAADWSLLARLPGQGNHRLAWHPQQPWLAAAEESGELVVWDAESGTALHRFKAANAADLGGAPRGVCWNAAGTRVALGGFRQVDLFNLGNASQTTLACPYRGEVLDWSADGKLLAVGGTSCVCAIDVESGQKLWQSYRSRIPVKDLAWNQEGTLLAATWEYPDYCIRVYDRDGQVVHRFNTESTIHAVAWNRDSTQLLSAGMDHRLHWWDMTTGEKNRVLAVSQHPIESLHVHPEEPVALIASSDERLRSVILSDKQPWEAELDVPTGPSRIWHLREHPKLANTWAVSSEHLIHVVDMDARKIVHSFSSLDRVGNFDWHPERPLLATLDLAGNVVVRDTKTGDTVSQWQANSYDFGVVIRWSPDGKRLLVGAGQKLRGPDSFVAEVIELAQPENRLVFGEFSPRSVARWLPDSKRVVVHRGSRDGTLQIWDVDAGIKLEQSAPLPGFLEQMDIDPQARRLVLTGRGGSLAIFDLPSLQLQASIKADSATIRSAKWSPDGKRLLTCADNGTLRLWDSASHDLLLSIDEEVGAVADWSHDGRRIATCSTDGLIRIWDSGSRD